MQAGASGATRAHGASRGILGLPTASITHGVAAKYQAGINDASRGARFWIRVVANTLQAHARFPTSELVLLTRPPESGPATMRVQKPQMGRTRRTLEIGQRTLTGAE